MSLSFLLCLATVWSISPPSARGTESSTPEEKPKPDAPATHTVAMGKLDHKVELNAFFEAKNQTALSIDPEVWTDLTVVEAVPHGSEVKEGDVVLRLDLEKIEKQIEDLEQSYPAKTLALEIATAELTNLEQTTPLKLAAAERNRDRADDDYSYFESVDRAVREKAVEYNIESATQRLANAQEELDQLLKMYEADDLTEETEEIILKRQEFSVKSAQYFLENAKRNAERSLKVLIPREGENLKAQKQDQELAWELSRVTLPKTLEQKRQAVQKLQKDQAEQDEKLADLKHDLKLLTVRAPRDGIVYYGDHDNGKWTTGSAVEKKLVPGGKVGPREVFMTIVDLDELILKAVVPENKLAHLKKGLEGEATPTSNPDLQLPAKLRSLNYVALPGGGFLAEIDVSTRRASHLMPGMSCQVVLGEDQTKKALLAPKSAVFEEEDEYFVYLHRDEESPERRVVKVGEQDDKMFEITRGLREGDKILMKKPDGK